MQGGHKNHEVVIKPSNNNSKSYSCHQGTAPHEDIQPSASCLTQYPKWGSTYGHIRDALWAAKTRTGRTPTVDVHGPQHSWSNQSFPFWTAVSHYHNSRELLNTCQAALWMLAEHTTQNIDVANAATKKSGTSMHSNVILASLEKTVLRNNGSP